MCEIKTIAVIGAGQMGGGIAQMAALNGYQVIVQDVSEQAWSRCLAKMKGAFDRLVEKEKLTQEKKEQILGSIRFTTELINLGEADFVIEAAPEILSLKQQIFQTLGEVCRNDTILCTNTSSMSVEQIMEKCKYPERCAGMHFFFPVHAMKLVEIIRSPQTSAKTVADVKQVAESIGKVAVECKTDTPGFIVNRCLFAFMLEAIHLYEEGVADIADIDTAIKLGLNHPLGPFELMDLSGLDTFPHVTETLEVLPVTTWKCPESVQKLIADGKFGKKSGEGWYPYS